MVSYIIFLLLLWRMHVEVMSQIGATSKANISFLLYLTFFPSVTLLPVAHSAALASAGISSWLSWFYSGGGLPCHKYSLPVVRYTEYVIVNGEQQSCVDL